MPQTGPHRKELPKRPSELITLDTRSQVEEVNSSDTFSKKPSDPLEVIAVPKEIIDQIPSTDTPSEPLENKYPSNAITQDSESIDSESDEDPFEPANPNLLIVMGRINNVPARILIDNGSVVNYIDEEFCQYNDIPIEDANHAATMANKISQETKVTAQKLQLSMGGYTKLMQFACIPLNYDAILGKKWTSKHKALIDSYSNEVIFRYKERVYRIIAVDPAENRLISANTISNYVKKNTPLCAIFIRPASEDTETQGPKISQEMETILKNYADVFPKELPRAYLPRDPMNSISN